MRTLSTLAALLILGISAQAAHDPIPYPAKPLTIIEPSGNRISLESLKGKVVVCEFMFTTCPHCQNAAKLFTKLQGEYGAQGFKALGIAFNPEVQGHPEVVKSFVSQFGVGYPIGFATQDQVLGYLQISKMEARWVVPQVMIVDRKGIVRAQSDPTGTEEVVDEKWLRPFIEKLLKEGTASTSTIKGKSPAADTNKAAPVASTKKPS